MGGGDANARDGYCIFVKSRQIQATTKKLVVAKRFAEYELFLMFPVCRQSSARHKKEEIPMT